MRDEFDALIWSSPSLSPLAQTFLHGAPLFVAPWCFAANLHWYSFTHGVIFHTGVVLHTGGVQTYGGVVLHTV